MRILVHDYAGHPFQVQLSRALAARGHTVLHAWCASLPNTARGPLDPAPDDPDTFGVRGIELDAPLDKYSYVRRWRQEREYGRRLTRTALDFAPDVVLSGNTPLDAQARLMRACARHDIRMVYWLQDLLGVATHRVLSAKLGLPGRLVGAHYVRRERALLRAADDVVVITDDFRAILRGYGLDDAHIHTVENWAPLEAMPERPRRNAWSARHGLDVAPVFVYSGNLGMKHNPSLLVALARALAERDPDARLVVVSEGIGADFLAAERERLGLENLVQLPFQPFADLPDVLASADVLVALLEPDAGVFSVPSKVLSYLCAGRALLLAVPPENLAARIVEREAAGRVVSPTAVDAFVDAGLSLAADADARGAMSARARAYAERTFDIEAIADRFERVLTKG